MSENSVPKKIPYDLVPRDEWGALPPKYEGKQPRFPVPHLVITYATGTDKCQTGEECKKLMRQLQVRHMEEEKFIDIGYNYVIGGDGRVYEGRGWNIVPESKKFPERNGKRFDIAYIGNYERDDISTEMFEATMQLLNEGSELRFLEENWDTVEDPGGDEAEQCHVEEEKEKE